MKERLIKHIQSITDPALRRTCESILTYDKFFTWPASLSHHHAYEGGLLAHTVEVCDIALGISGLSISGKLDGAPWEQMLFPKKDRNVLIAAALWHDVMKTEEYITADWSGVKQSELNKTRHLTKRCNEAGFEVWIKDETRVKMFGNHEHIITGAMEFMMIATHYKLAQAIAEAVTHCILAHHGRNEWGSPVEPQTIEALILHQADMLSAQYGATKEVAL